MNKLDLMLKCGGAGLKAGMKKIHAKYSPDLMSTNGYPIHSKTTMHWDWHATKKNEYNRRMMIFNR